MYWKDYIKTYKNPKNLTLPFKKKMMKSNMNLDDFFEAMSYPFEEMTYYVAACCYTGFDVAGFMKFYIIKDIDRLLKYAVDMPTINLLSKYKF
jgi:hypothetical protein